MNYNFQSRGEETKKGWYSRGYLPHFDGGEVPQFATFRLFDSLPQALFEQWQNESVDDVAFRKRIESYLDSGSGTSWLKEEQIGVLIQKALLFHHGKKYKLTAWVVMPNYVHLLATPCEDVSLSEILHSIRSYTAHEANKLLDRRGAFWQHESFDRYIRNHKHFLSVIKYIENNPVVARLCEKPEEWRFSSASLKSRSNLIT